MVDRVLRVAAYWQTNLTLWRLTPLLGASKSAADRIINDLDLGWPRLRTGEALKNPAGTAVYKATATSSP